MESASNEILLKNIAIESCCSRTRKSHFIHLPGLLLVLVILSGEAAPTQARAITLKPASQEEHGSEMSAAPKSNEEDTKVKVNYPDEYEEAVGDFKRPGAILDKFRTMGEIGFIHGFVAAVSVIIVSELGDKTFFIAAIMAMRHPRITVFLGAMSALAIMTILSACLGFATTVIPRMYTHYISTALFAIFGLKMLKEGYSMSPDEGHEEYEEVQKTLHRKESELEKENMADDLDNSKIVDNFCKNFRRRLMVLVSRVFLQALTMTFLAEWGDRSQLATIILAAREDAVGVTIGAIIGHAMCTLLAVLGGRMVAQKISVRSVTLIGGVVFLIFAVSALIIGPGT